MNKGILYILALTVFSFSAALAAEGDNAGQGQRRQQGGAPTNQAKIMLQHADELALTADQKAKLEEFAKGPMSVLTDEQKTKAREIIRANVPQQPGGRRPQQPAKPADAEKKTEEVKK